ncbi:hypothetical protein KP509_33G055100 [Ceratopteris richardii]|nr:hypothetical protein KP509_33G055100 [Ceratopteris richardii]
MASRGECVTNNVTKESRCTRKSSGPAMEETQDEDDGCYTPRKKECMIPRIRFCPPAPRKRKPCFRLLLSRKQLSAFLVVPDFDAFFPCSQGVCGAKLPLLS